MENFSKILTIKKDVGSICGEVVAIYFEAKNREGAILEFTFMDKGRMCRHDVEFQTKKEGREVFEAINSDNIQLVNKKFVMNSQVSLGECKTIQ